MIVVSGASGRLGRRTVQMLRRAAGPRRAPRTPARRHRPGRGDRRAGGGHAQRGDRPLRAPPDGDRRAGRRRRDRPRQAAADRADGGRLGRAAREGLFDVVTDVVERIGGRRPATVADRDQEARRARARVTWCLRSAQPFGIISVSRLHGRDLRALALRSTAVMNRRRGRRSDRWPGSRSRRSHS